MTTSRRPGVKPGEKMSEAQAREAVRRLCGGLRKALEMRAARGAEAIDPRTEADLALLSMWADASARLTLRQLDDLGERAYAVSAEREGDAKVAAEVLWSASHVARFLSAEEVECALRSLTALVPGCGRDVAACAPVARAMDLGGDCDGCADLAHAFAGPLLRASAVPQRRKGEWPDVGITCRGSWGSRDCLRWERVDGPLVVGGTSGFVAGFIVETPAEAREAMVTTVRGWRPHA